MSPLLHAPSAPYGAAADAARGAVHRLTREFPAVPRRTIDRVVRASRADLSGVPAGAVPELLERVARQRLLDRARGQAAD